MKKCPLCNSPEVRNFNQAGKDYLLYQCSQCKLIFDSNSPGDNQAFYNEEYYKSEKIKGGYFNYIAETIINKLTFDHRLKAIGERIKKDSKLLDIGCALGDFLEVARDKEWINSSGIEISDYSIKQCQKKGLKVIKYDPKEKKKILENSVDVVTLQDVIEHVHDPLKQMREINKLLRPGGLLFMTTPNIDSLSGILLGKYWYHFKKGEHLVYFNRSNLKLLLIKAGFTNIEIKPTPSWVTIQYIINRLHYYLPNIPRSLIDKIFNNLLFKIPFPLYTGEIESWAIKPK